MITIQITKHIWKIVYFLETSSSSFVSCFPFFWTTTLSNVSPSFSDLVTWYQLNPVAILMSLLHLIYGQLTSLFSAHGLHMTSLPLQCSLRLGIWPALVPFSEAIRGEIISSNYFSGLFMTFPIYFFQ